MARKASLSYDLIILFALFILDYSILVAFGVYFALLPVVLFLHTKALKMKCKSCYDAKYGAWLCKKHSKKYMENYSFVSSKPFSDFCHQYVAVYRNE